MLVASRGPGYVRAAGGSEGAEFYNALIDSSIRGNAEAREALQMFSDYAAKRGVAPEVLATSATSSRAVEALAGASLRVEGLAPFWVRIDNITDISSPRELSDYIAARDAALTYLAAADPDRRISVQVAFTNSPSLSDVLSLAAKYDATWEQIHLEALVDGERLFTHVIAESAAANLTGASAAEVQASLAGLIVEADIPTCGVSPSAIEWQPGLVRLSTNASSAVAIRESQGIAAVDPLADVQEHFSRRAASVTVGDWPRVDQSLNPMADLAC